MFLRLFVVLSVATTMSSAFTVPFHSNSNGFVAFGRQQQQRTTFASSVHMSDETATEPAASDAVAAVEAPASSSEPELTAEETAAKRKIQRERHTLFVGNLPFETSEADIKAMFEPHGKVNLVNIPRDRITKKPRGFAFVDMNSAEELDAAIAGVDGATCQDRAVRVSKSVAKEDVDRTKREKPDPMGAPEGTKKIYMGNIPFTTTKEEISSFFAEYGSVADVYIPQNPETGEGRGFAFVTMQEDDVQKAIDGTNGAEFGGRLVVVNEPLPKGKKSNRKDNRTKLYIGNLSFYTVAETLEMIFGEFGEILDCYLPEDPSTGGSRGFGFVTMGRDDAMRAIAEIDGCEVDGRVIKVNEAQPKGRFNENDSNNDDDDEE